MSYIQILFRDTQLYAVLINSRRQLLFYIVLDIIKLSSPVYVEIDIIEKNNVRKITPDPILIIYRDRKKRNPNRSLLYITRTVKKQQFN